MASRRSDDRKISGRTGCSVPVTRSRSKGAAFTSSLDSLKKYVDGHPGTKEPKDKILCGIHDRWGRLTDEEKCRYAEEGARIAAEMKAGNEEGINDFKEMQKLMLDYNYFSYRCYIVDTETKGRYAAQSIPAKKYRDLGDKDQGKSAGVAMAKMYVPTASQFSPQRHSKQRRTEELIALKEQVEDLQRKLLEKDELLKLAEIPKNQMISLHAKLDELKLQVSEKDPLLNSTQLQLSDAKIKLADKQLALEKLQWEAMTSNRKVEKFQEDLDTMQGEISFMLLFEGLTKNNYNTSARHDDVAPYYFSDHLPVTDDLDDMEMQKVEEAREVRCCCCSKRKAR